jgi:para-aminobenzoate synthetase component 1
LSRLEILPLPYSPSPCDYFERLRGLPAAVLLDSARPRAQGGRFDLLSALPLELVEHREGRSLSRDEAGRVLVESEGSPFRFLDERLAARHFPARPLIGEWPFAGGAMGLFGYSLGSRVAGQALRACAALPAMRVGIYGWALMQDHELRRTALVFTPLAGPECRRRVLEALEAPRAREPLPGFRLAEPFRCNVDATAYRGAFERVREYILAGDCYQVNLAMRLSAAASGDPWEAYRRLRETMGSPFSGYLESEGAAVLSFSPERFLRLTNDRVETRPIKGTARRGPTPAADTRAAERLLASAKDRAENVMIVDLMRNDIGKACETGSVHVEKLCGLESYANVHHLVSVVTGRLRADQSALTLLEHAFPGGSITGAPKRRAMQIIAELEPDARSVYCGSLGYVSSHGTMDTSIAIRTLLFDGREVHAWGGGGLTIDSEADAEHRECLTKIEPLMRGLETP